MTQIAIRSVAERPRPAFLDGGTKQLFIDGKWAPAESGETLVTIDPATEQPLAVVAAGGRADVNRAVDAARRAFEDPAWRGMQPRERGRLLMRIARLIDAHKDELSILESLDTGMPIRMTRGMLDGVVNALEYYSGWPTKICGETLPSGPDTFAYTTREPLGVCAGITPWNSPLVIAIWKLAPALACGNTFILKPAEQTPLTAIRLGELLAEADLPPGVVNIITGYRRASWYQQVVLHRLHRGGSADCRRIGRESQTGHARAGREVAEHRVRGRRSQAGGRRRRPRLLRR
jgi:acyl-CoA reductase-like NAD-dependent aldehyde dehydrogenase